MGPHHQKDVQKNIMMGWKHNDAPVIVLIGRIRQSDRPNSNYHKLIHFILLTQNQYWLGFS